PALAVRGQGIDAKRVVNWVAVPPGSRGLCINGNPLPSLRSHHPFESVGWHGMGKGGSLDDLALWITKTKRSIRLQFDRKAILVHEAMMARTHLDEVSELGFSALAPVLDVMRL